MTTKQTKPTWANKLLGADVEVINGKVVLTFDATGIVAEGPATTKDGTPQEPTLYFLRTPGSGIEVPELAVDGVVPVISINGWFPRVSAPRSGQVLAKVVSAADRLAAARRK